MFTITENSPSSSPHQLISSARMVVEIPCHIVDLSPHRHPAIRRRVVLRQLLVTDIDRLSLSQARQILARIAQSYPSDQRETGL